MMSKRSLLSFFVFFRLMVGCAPNISFSTSMKMVSVKITKLFLNPGGPTGFILFFIVSFLISSVSSDNRTCLPHLALEIRYRILDEFGDEASVLRKGGTLEIFCQAPAANHQLLEVHVETPSRKFDIQYVAPNISVAVIPEKPWEIGTSGEEKYTFNVSCRCKDCNKTSEVLRFGDILCDTVGNWERCGPTVDQFCFVDESGTNRCSQRDTSTKFCPDLSKSYNLFLPCSCHSVDCVTLSECNAFYAFNHVNPANISWPEAEISINNSSLCKEAERYWEDGYTNFGLRGVIPVNATFILKPNDSKVPDCINRSIGCELKMKTIEVKTVKLTGSCQEGWRVEAEEIWNSTKTKLVCSSRNNTLRWQYYLYPIVAKLINSNMCHWPVWMNLTPTPPEDGECKKTVRFDYPPTVKGKWFDFFPKKIPTTTTVQVTTVETRERRILTTSHSLKSTEADSFNTTEAVSLNTTKPVSLNTTKPVSLNTTKPVSLDTNEPVSLDTTGPVSLQATEQLSLNTPMVSVITQAEDEVSIGEVSSTKNNNGGLKWYILPLVGAGAALVSVLLFFTLFAWRKNRIVKKKEKMRQGKREEERRGEKEEPGREEKNEELNREGKEKKSGREDKKKTDQTQTEEDTELSQ